MQPQARKRLLETDLAELAQQLSACSSAAQGGNLGQISRGQTVPEFETFLFNLEPGQICPVPVGTVAETPGP